MTPFGPLADGRGDPPATDAYWVVPERFAAGAHPLANGRDRLDDLLADGFDVFVNLTAQHVAGSTDVHLGDPSPAVWAAGGRVVDIPITDLDVPTIEQAGRALDVIDDALGSGSRVYVHCWAGVGRTGTIVGCWLVRHGIDPALAVGELRGLRWPLMGDSPQTEEQVAFVEAWPEGRWGPP